MEEEAKKKDTFEFSNPIGRTRRRTRKHAGARNLATGASVATCDPDRTVHFSSATSSGVRKAITYGKDRRFSSSLAVSGLWLAFPALYSIASGEMCFGMKNALQQRSRVPENGSAANVAHAGSIISWEQLRCLGCTELRA